MKLVGTHHAADLVAPAQVIEGRDTRPEAGDIEDQLCAVGIQKLDVVSNLEVLPDVISDGTAYVTLQVGVIEHPTLRARVQVECLSLFLTIASALPGEHRPLVSGRSGGGACLAQASITVHQK